jgi:hypothetical protein
MIFSLAVIDNIPTPSDQRTIYTVHTVYNQFKENVTQ